MWECEKCGEKFTDKIHFACAPLENDDGEMVCVDCYSSWADYVYEQLKDKYNTNCGNVG